MVIKCYETTIRIRIISYLNGWFKQSPMSDSSIIASFEIACNFLIISSFISFNVN